MIFVFMSRKVFDVKKLRFKLLSCVGGALEPPADDH